MYDWRYISDIERAKVLKGRKIEHRPWHAPPKFDYEGKTRFIVTATCYEHRHIVGMSPDRMAECEAELQTICKKHCSQLFAWCILPNHYHLLVDTMDIEALQAQLGKFHGRSSFKWNGEDAARGRKVWYRSFERPMASERHFYVSLNYIHHNPVKHGYVKIWQDWPCSSASQFLETVGREKALEIWDKYPVLDYGREWDPA